MHKHTHHVGKVPGSGAAPGVSRSEAAAVAVAAPVLPAILPEANTRTRLSELKEALSKSVEDEDYEEAARLRDAISRLESLLEGA